MTNVTKREPTEVRIVWMGDSITAGQHVDRPLVWTSLVGDRLRQVHSDASLSVRAVNAGVSGNTSRQGLERFTADVLEFEPDVVTLQFGLNDCNCWATDGGSPRVPPAEYRANLVEMIDRVRGGGASRLVILSNNHPTLRTETVMASGERFEDANARYCGIVEDVALSRGVDFCDVRKAFLDKPRDSYHRLLLPFPDHLHLSAEGQIAYADAIWPHVDRAVRKVATRWRTSDPAGVKGDEDEKFDRSALESTGGSGGERRGGEPRGPLSAGSRARLHLPAPRA